MHVNILYVCLHQPIGSYTDQRMERSLIELGGYTNRWMLHTYSDVDCGLNSSDLDRSDASPIFVIAKKVAENLTSAREQSVTS